MPTRARQLAAPMRTSTEHVPAGKLKINAEVVPFALTAPYVTLTVTPVPSANAAINAKPPGTGQRSQPRPARELIEPIPHGAGVRPLLRLAHEAVPQRGDHAVGERRWGVREPCAGLRGAHVAGGPVALA